jgi:hypothetical protein
MSCEECNKVQIENRKGINLAFIRVGAADVLVSACDKHFNELRDKIGIKHKTDVFRVKNMNNMDEELC